MAKKKQIIEIPKAVPKKRKALKPKKPTAIAIPKAEVKPRKPAKPYKIEKASTRKPKRKFEKREKPAQNFSTGDMQNNSIAEAFAKAGLTAESFKK
tara:strand:- start:31 stop:318 length:288 start_codon:yes stop_codon:yes gene_type:complete